MTNEELERLGQVISKDSYLYQLAQKDALESLETSERDILEPEAIQERADEFRKDEPENV